MDIMIQGCKKRYIQIGTVMTDEKYRNNGLSIFLMEKIICARHIFNTRNRFI
ncbi:hypothetical protein [Clostridium perfringens]|uniref:hypothetical protein n=1 Tax=Clostridium perfringens TaxID=1502 RepID=UPI0024BD2CC3|nr:hypothetical protein [Clostridium perfringens]